MAQRSILRALGKWLLVSALLGFGFAMAQSEPTLNQIYEAAQSGRLEQAQVMMQQVLVAHPGSGKAHFVQAELFARQGKLEQGRESLAMAEKLSPALPFAKREAVQALRSQLAARTAVPQSSSARQRADAGAAGNASPSPTPASSSFPWGLALALGGGLIGIAIFLKRKKPAPAFEPQTAYAAAGPSGLNGPQGFGMGSGAGGAAMQAPYGQAAGSGLGGRIMGGVATGLAVGAGVMAAQAIGRNLMGNHDQGAKASEGAAGNDFQAVDSNADMGGQNFGIDQAGSWDDGGGLDSGGDWDS
ncbi:MAG: tetratricopeptide repeat protein [Rhodoferax sp.]